MRASQLSQIQTLAGATSQQIEWIVIQTAATPHTMLLSGDDLSHLPGPVTLDTILHHLESRYYLQSYQVSSAMEIMFQINVKLRGLLRKD